MKLVVDANILFSALIKEGKTVELLRLPSIEFYSSSFVMEEFEKYKEEILSKTHRTKEEFWDIFKELKEIVSIIPDEEFVHCVDEAEGLTPDPKDMTYFALALHLGCGIWSNDKKLKEQMKVKVYTTEEITGMFEK